ncbi:MAG: hypothetical protein LBM94_05365 [Propionibacteriaceae bacterium]|nr:hypothetical protein [Propionibacteriaceae bacterium]
MRWVITAYPDAFTGLDDVARSDTYVFDFDPITGAVLDAETVLTRLDGLTCLYVLDAPSRPFFSAEQVMRVEEQGFTEAETATTGSARITRMCQPG